VPLFKVTAKRETFYEFVFEAENSETAVEMMCEIESSEEVEEYAYDWWPLTVETVVETDMDERSL
jgi:hypothetical protein